MMENIELIKNDKKANQGCESSEKDNLQPLKDILTHVNSMRTLIVRQSFPVQISPYYGEIVRKQDKEVEYISKSEVVDLINKYLEEAI